MTTARDVALRVLHRVAEDGAWAAPCLDAEIGRAGLDAREAGLTTQIVYGTLRALPSLDAVLDGFLRTPTRTDPGLRAGLRVGAFQLLHLARVPPHAAVGETVQAVRGARGAKLAGVANAVLRKVAKLRPEAPALPARIETPAWVEAELEASLGAARAADFLRGRELPPWVGLRARDDVEGLLEAFRAARPEAELRRAGPSSIAVRRAGDPRRLPGFEEGRFVVQELGSQAVVEAVEAAAGERIADLCAGRGGKTLALLDAVGPSGTVVAADRFEEKLAKLVRQARRLGLGEVATHPVDLTVGVGGLEGGYDRVLVDAPCTGLGTIHRRPELLLRLRPEDPARLAATQGALLARAATLVRPGGLLVYAVCSPTTAEGRAVGDGVPDGFVIDPPSGSDADGVLRIGSWQNAGDVERDAYQVLRWRRVDPLDEGRSDG